MLDYWLADLTLFDREQEKKIRNTKSKNITQPLNDTQVISCDLKSTNFKKILRFHDVSIQRNLTYNFVQRAL